MGIMASIKDSAIKSIGIPVPELDEQQRIIKILDDAFEKIKQGANQVQTKLYYLNRFISIRFSEITELVYLENTEELLFSENGSIRTGPFGSQLLHREFVDEGIAVLGIDNAVNNEFRGEKKIYY